MVRPVRVLLTNDDGIDARGLKALVVATAAWARRAPGRELVVVAPDRNYSGAGASVGEVYRRSSIAYSRSGVAGADDVECFALDASPALCVLVGVLGGMGPRPDVVVAGVNAGVNVGRSVLHSGTVGAILTGSQLGLSGLSVSMQWTDDPPFEVAAGVRRGRVSTAGIVRAADQPADPLAEAGEIALRLGSAVPALGDVSDEEPEDDGALVAAGFASITPLRSVHEDTDAGADDAIRAALDAVSHHLHAAC